MESTTEKCKVAVVGNVDSGKSTLTGVLTKGEYDDGRGSARERVFNYVHEHQNGRTTSITSEIIGFNHNGEQMLPERFIQNKNKYWKEVVEKSHKVINLVDLCGHEKYLKTTIYGLVAQQPDYSMIVVGANMGVSKMSREHLGICLFLNIPFYIVVTKIDLAPKNVYQETINTLKLLIKSPSVKRTPILFDETSSDEDVATWAQKMPSNQVVPVFQVSSVSGAGLPQLKRFLFNLRDRTKTNKAFQGKDDPIHYDIQDSFNVDQVGRVVSGIVRAGTIKVGSVLLLGPNQNKQYKPVVVKGIHCNRVQVNEALPGEQICLALKSQKASDKLERSDFRKGCVLVDIAVRPEAVWEFEANVHVLHHPTTMSVGYQAVMHCGVVRQAVAIKQLSTKESIKSGDIELTRFRFLYSPEFLKTNQIIVIREGRTKIFGMITALITDKQLELEKQS